MVYEMVAGQPPFVAEAPGDILMAHIMQPAPALTSLQPDVPPAIAAMVAQMLAKEPTARPQSMAEIVATVEGLLGVRKTDFGPALRRPAGFPDGSAQAVTQILPGDEVSGARQTPSPPRRESPSGPGALTPIAAAGSHRGVGTPRGSNRGGSTPLAGPVGTAAGSTEYPLSPSPIRRFLPAIIILAVVAVGGTTAYFLTRPGPSGEPATVAEPGKNAEPPPSSEVEIEILSNPGGATVQVTGETSSRGPTPAKFTLPRSSAAVEIVLRARGYLDKRLALDATRDRTMNINLEREPSEAAHVPQDVNKTAENKPEENKPDENRKAEKKRKGASRSPATAGGGFRAVGD
jgi:hypothetical protein